MRRRRHDVLIEVNKNCLRNSTEAPNYGVAVVLEFSRISYTLSPCAPRAWYFTSLSEFLRQFCCFIVECFSLTMTLHS
jgi:hypothetical protein